MKLITLNIWGGKVFEPLMEFFQTHSRDIDIFCLQEVYKSNTPNPISLEARANVFNELEMILPDFHGFYAPIQDGYDYLNKVDFSISFGLAIFVKKELEVKSVGDVFVYRYRNSREKDNSTMGRNLQHVRINVKKTFTVFNLHGLWNGGPKTDTQDRIEQSKKVKSELDSVLDSKILCGDFNLLPDTQSIKIVEEGMRNLVKETGVTSTRTSYYKKDPKFADYILVSPDVKVNEFKVLPDEVSDHSPLMLDFEL